MMAETAVEPSSNAHTLVFSRSFSAPIRDVFKAWTDPDVLKQWWGPRGFELTISRMDVRVGGTWDYVLIAPDGSEFPNRAVFEVVDPPNKLVFYNFGGHVTDQHLTCRMVVDFVERDGETQVTLQMIFQSGQELERAVARGASTGGREAFERLGEYLWRKSHELH